MKVKNYKIAIIALMAVSIQITACEKKSNDDFPPGDVPPTAGGFTATTQIAPANLVAYWNFNGELKDSVTNVMGTNAGMTFSPGLKGQALTGKTDASLKAYATAPASAAVKAMTQYTVSCWINTPQNTGATGIVSLGDTQNFWANINIFLENGGTATKARIKTIYGDNGSTFDNNIQDIENGLNNWTNYIISYDGAGTFKSYVNGTLARTNTVATMGPIRFTNVGPIVFGTLHFMTVPSSTTASPGEGWAGYLPGKIDEVRIYNKALSAIEISALSILERQGR
ncbi:LamG domain-containing protein [Pedobacter sp. MW01-1-1]|uniref:LamG domain-containing protein n=1 Tax=Pedobacter sp. MW01-1-1 TaxID=3383027 RepID=UPI003FEE997A